MLLTLLISINLNQNGEINILDIVRVIAIILDDKPSEYELWDGDLNTDGSIDILDIIIMVSIILEIR